MLFRARFWSVTTRRNGPPLPVGIRPSAIHTERERIDPVCSTSCDRTTVAPSSTKRSARVDHEVPNELCSYALMSDVWIDNARNPSCRVVYPGAPNPSPGSGAGTTSPNSSRPWS